jgi:hypothetical protein
MSDSSAGQIVGGVVGGVIGFFVGGPAGAFQGFSIGYSLGGLVDPPSGPNVEGPRLDDKKVITSTYGDPITLAYGPNTRLSGNVIWSTGLIEAENEEESGGKGGGGGSTSTTYTYSLSFDMAIMGRPGRQIRRVWMNNKLVFNIADAVGSPFLLPTYDAVNGMLYTKDMGTHVVFDEMHFWPGTTTQIADAMVEAIEGVGAVPAYRGICHVSFKNLQLADFGNRLPNVEVELEADTTIALSQVVHDICGRAGVENTSVIGLTDLVSGYVIARPSNGSGAIAPLGMAYHFDMAEQRGQIRFVKRARGMKATISIDQMGCHQANENPTDPIRHSTLSTVELPKQMTVSFADPALDYQVNSQRAIRDQGATENLESVQFPLTLTVDEGRRIADRLLWSPWAARKSATFKVDDTWVRRDPGDVLGIQVSDQVVPYKLLRMNRGDNGVIEAEVQRDDPELYNSTADGTAGRLPDNSVRFPGVTRLILMDAPILRDLDDNSGFYWAVTAPSTGWRGANILRSSDGGTTYTNMSDVIVRTRIGDVASALPSGPTAYWDRGNTLTVVMQYTSHTLESVTEAQVLNGANAFLLGDEDGQNGEIAQFATATLVGANTYELSDLLRGRLGTEANVGIHGANEVFVLLNLSTMGRSDFGPADWEIERDYKPVSLLTDQADVTAQQFTNNGVGMTPLSPVHVLGVRDGSNNLTVDWVRRSRLRSAGLAGPVPLGEETEAYEVDIYSGASVVRTITATAPTISYSAAEQTTDGLTPGNPVSLRVFQMSAVRGRGFPAISIV